MDAGLRHLLFLSLWLAVAGYPVPVRAQANANQPAEVSAVVEAEAVAAGASQPSRVPDVENRVIRRTGDARTAAGRDGESAGTRYGGGWWMWLQTLGILAVVLAVMAVVLKGLRRAGLGKSFGGSTATIQILSRGYLSNKHQMVLVRFGQRILLLGMGPQNLCLLSEVGDPGEAAEILARLEGGKPGSISQDFRQTIDSVVRQYEREGTLEPAVTETPLTDETSSVGSLRQELRGLLAKMQSIGRKSAE